MPAKPETEAGQWIVRRVASNGVMSVDNQMFSVGNTYRGELVDVLVDQTVIQVWSKNHLVKTVARERSGPVRKDPSRCPTCQPTAEYEPSSIR